MILQTITKTSVKIQNNRHKTEGVACTSYPPTIHFECNNTCSSCEVTKNNLRIISKPHEHLQTTTKTPVKFQRNLHETVGGVAHTRYVLQNHRRPNARSPCFSSKRLGTQNQIRFNQERRNRYIFNFGLVL